MKTERPDCRVRIANRYYVSGNQLFAIDIIINGLGLINLFRLPNLGAERGKSNLLLTKLRPEEVRRVLNLISYFGASRNGWVVI
ncbi:hypothetical protein TNIN_293451 [Trichonephila inaurata madagascariensis]|uniref:Uncharacterized protein n=1 Tax=Trichonephila inaurata madagascariensis TaxID=2747483 RepID=A0A8X6WVN2_9ARAC|nr:hypothetical protein TNIN_293451 [Trichonephila inaurata madagascariensis]